jgi:SRSO17 transposase
LPYLASIHRCILLGGLNRTTASSKGALGLDHFEGRSFGGWHHHVTLVAVAHGFLTLERLSRPKPAASA